jgi:hypothetical protein
LKNEENINKTKSNFKKDCQVLSKFAQGMKSQFQINSHDYLTLPSLALAIFRKKFLTNNSFITPPSGNASQYIRSGLGISVY